MRLSNRPPVFAKATAWQAGRWLQKIRHSCSGRFLACIATFVLAADTAASTGEILADLQLLGTNVYLR
jgi:hypothetical protein